MYRSGGVEIGLVGEGWKYIYNVDGGPGLSLHCTFSCRYTFTCTCNCMYIHVTIFFWLTTSADKQTTEEAVRAAIGTVCFHVSIFVVHVGVQSTFHDGLMPPWHVFVVLPEPRQVFGLPLNDYLISSYA